MGSSVGEHDSGAVSHRTSSVGRVIRSISQAFGIANPQFDAQQIVSYVDSNFVINNDKLMEILEEGSSTDKMNAINLLEGEMVNISSEKRLKLWESVKSKISLKKEGTLRTESLKLLHELLNFSDVPKTKGLEFYIDICENINFNGIDKDMKLFLVCFHSLLKFSDLDSLEKYPEHPLNDFLVKLYNHILTYNSEELEVLIISLISQCVAIDKHLFTSDDLHDLFDNIINISIKTTNMIVIQSFLDFFKSFLLTGYKYDEKLYSVISILGCAYGLEDIEASDKCESLMDLLLTKDKSSQLLFLLCDVTVGRCDDKYPHRSGNRSIIGCLRYVSYTLKYIKLKTDVGKIITSFFEHHLDYLFQTLITLAKSSNDIIFIEILKFIDEVLEKPYSMNGYYKYFIERNDFWELLKLLSWTNGSPSSYSSGSYQVVLNELFNKLQNFKLNNFYVSKLIAYLDINYEILSSYNITYVLNYYSKNLTCVCGALYWKANCQNVVQKYYRTAPYSVLNLLKKSFLYCIPLKIDEPSLDFYIGIICYNCIIGLNFKLDDDILDPITDVILKLDNKMFEKVINDYQLEIRNFEDKNLRILCKILIIATLKGTAISNIPKKMNILLNSIVKITEYTQTTENSGIFISCILLLTRIRSHTKDSKKYYYISEFKNDEANSEPMLSKNTYIDKNGNTIEEDYKVIDQKITQMFEIQFRDLSFEQEIRKYFKNGKTNLFTSEIDGNILLELYIRILGNTEDWQHYFIILKNLRNQLLNYELFDNECSANIVGLMDLFTQQMQFIYTFKFDTPRWIEIKHIRIAIVEVLYGLFPYKKIIPIREGESLLRSIVLDFHFCDITRISYLNFLNSCMFELPQVMKHFILPILKMISDDISKPQTMFSNLEFFLNLFELVSSDYYELTEKELKIIPCILSDISNYQIEEKDVNYDEIECSKILANLIQMKLGNGDDKDESLKFKNIVKFIDIDNTHSDSFASLFKDLVARFRNDELGKCLVDHSGIDTLKIRGSDRLYNITEKGEESIINVIFSDKNIDCTIIQDCLKKKIVVTSIEDNKDYFNISNYGFDFINMRSVVIERANVGKFIKVLIELCLISTLKKIEIDGVKT